MSSLLPILRVNARYWLQHKVQAALCLAGVTLGVALFTAIHLANEGALGAFGNAVDTFLGKATHRVRNPAGSGVSEKVFADLQEVPGVLAASPLSEDRLRIVGVPGEFHVLAIDPLTDTPFRDEPFLAEAAPSQPDESVTTAAASESPLELLLTVPGATLIPRALADQAHLRVGSPFQAEIGGQVKTLIAAAIYVPPAAQANILNTTLLMDIATQQELFGRYGRVDMIRLILRPGSEAQVESRLPRGLTLEPAGRSLERVDRMSHAFRLNLEALGLFSLLVGAFVILNAATFSVVQREARVALLRCIGASRRSIALALLAEAALVGAVGAVFGVLLGRFLAGYLVKGTSATVLEVILNTGPLPAPITLTPDIWLIGLLLGVATSLGGAAIPMVETYRVTPLRVLQASRWVTGQPAQLRRWLMGAAFCALTAVALLTLPGKSLEASLAGATAVIVAGALVCPPALWVAAWALRPALVRLFGATGRLAADQTRRSVARTGLAGASLMVALSLALSVGITVSSFRTTFGIWLEQTLTADLYLSFARDPEHSAFDPVLISRLRALPFVSDLAELKTRRIALGDRDVLVVAVDAQAFGRLNRVPIRQGDRTAAVSELAHGGAWVSETLANPLDLAPGSMLSIPGESGGTSLRIAAIVQNYSTPNGMIYLDRNTFRRIFGDVATRQAALWLKPGASLQDAAQAVANLAGEGALRVTSNRDLRESALRVFERTFAITRLMTGLSALVAFVAVISASAALLDERRPLFGYLRALGVSRKRLGISMALEATVLALVSTIISWGIGYLVSAILVFVVNRRAFGWTLQFLPGEGRYLSLLLWAVVAALLGTAIPIQRMWRSPILSAIREE